MLSIASVCRTQRTYPPVVLPHDVGDTGSGRQTAANLRAEHHLTKVYSPDST